MDGKEEVGDTNMEVGKVNLCSEDPLPEEVSELECQFSPEEL